MCNLLRGYCLDIYAIIAEMHHVSDPAPFSYVMLCNRPWYKWLLSGTALGIILLWLITQHVLLNNMLGISLCVLWISTIRVPNVKTCSVIFLALFIYDIFWVRISKLWGMLFFIVIRLGILFQGYLWRECHVHRLPSLSLILSPLNQTETLSGCP